MTRVVQRVLALMECFDEARPSLTLHELAARAGLPKTTAFRLLQSLLDSGYVVQLGNQEYCLSHKLMRLASIAQRTFSIRDIARPAMLEALAATHETVELSILSGTLRVCVEVMESPHPLKSIISPGETLELTAGASGKLLLAYSEPDFVERALSASKRTVNRRALAAEMKKIRASGYAHSHGERVEGAEAISVPLHDHLGRVRYCLTLTGPSFRIAPRKQKLVQAMIEAGAKISRSLGAPQARKVAIDAA